MTEHPAAPDPPAERSPTSSPATRMTQVRRPPGMAALQRALAATTAVLLAIDAYVHFHDAGLYDSVSTATLSQGALFRAQAAAAAVVAIALLIRPRPAVWAIAAFVAASAATAVLLYTYFDVGALGPLPNMYEPTWALPGKRGSAAAESAAALLAGTGLVLSLEGAAPGERLIRR
jgi:hypothetical protein